MTQIRVWEMDPTNSQGVPLSEEFWRVPRPALPRFSVQGTERALGLLASLPERGLAIVGTRVPAAKSVEQVRRCVRALAGREYVILSGLARGIDSIAHEAALQAGLPTIAILGAGLDCPYPRFNAELRARILEADGLIISEFAAGEIPHAGNFLKRNRLIAHWSKACWVVEAAHRSGALNTARHARESGRLVLATPCYPGDPLLAGNQGLIDRHHAEPLWGIHSLGVAWTELATAGSPDSDASSPEKKRSPLEADADRLTARVRSIELDRNRAQVSELLDWATASGWSPARFFTALQYSIQSGRVLDENGLLLKNPHHYS